MSHLLRRSSRCLLRRLLRHLLLTILPLSTALALTGCAMPNDTQAPAAHTSRPSLYQALGGKVGVVQVVDGLLERIARDPRIVHHFDETDIAIFRERLIEHLCAVTDGGCVYQGENMADSHRGLNITQADFDALVGHLIESMKDADVPTSTRNALLKRLAPMYGDVTYQ